MRISEILHPLTCSCEVDVVVKKYGGVVDLEVSRVEVEACRIVKLGEKGKQESVDVGSPLKFSMMSA